MRQYPYDLLIETSNQTGWDDKGNPIAGNQGFAIVSKCRDEANSKGGKRQLDDGSYYSYDTLVQLPKSNLILKSGTKFQVKDGDYIRVEGEIMRFEKGRLHSRLWA